MLNKVGVLLFVDFLLNKVGVLLFGFKPAGTRGADEDRQVAY